MVVLETRLVLLHQPRSSEDGSGDAGRHPGTNFKIIHSTEVSAEVSNKA
jgi:hypothetical protein